MTVETPRLRPAVHVPRLANALIRADVEGPDAALRGDPATRAFLAVVRGEVSPLATSSPGWPEVVANEAFPDYIDALAPVSVTSRLMGEGTRLSIAGRQSVTVNARQGRPGGAALVAEAAPAPVYSATLQGVAVRRAKIVGHVVMTRELSESPAGPAALETMLAENFAAGLDEAVLSTVPGDETTPAGLRAGAVEVAAAAAGPDAMASDIEAVAAAVLAAGVRVVFVAAPITAFRLSFRMAEKGLEVWPTLALPEGTLMGIDPGAFVSGLDPRPRFDVADHATYHMVDVDPAQITTPGAPATIAAPATSVWQVDAIGLRLTGELAWGMRAPAAAVVNDVTWA